LTLIVTIWTGVLFSGCVAFGNTDSPNVLQILRANDAKFDNLDLKYTRFEDHKIRPDRFQLSKFGDDPSKMPQDYWTPRTVKWTRSCSLVVRGGDAVHASQFESGLSEKDKYVTPSAYSKSGNVDGIVYDLSDMQLSDNDPSKNVPNYEKQLRITRLRSPTGGLHDARMAIEFAHGVGFGKRIQSISSVTTEGDRPLITGQIKLWTQDMSEFEIELDKEHLVRKAVIRCNVQGNNTHFEVITEGTVNNEGLLLAKSGSFRRTHQPSDEQ